MLTEEIQNHLTRRGEQSNAYKTKKVWFEVLEIIKRDWESKPLKKNEAQNQIFMINNIVNLCISKKLLNQPKDAFSQWATMHNTHDLKFKTEKFTWKK